MVSSLKYMATQFYIRVTPRSCDKPLRISEVTRVTSSCIKCCDFSTRRYEIFQVSISYLSISLLPILHESISEKNFLNSPFNHISVALNKLYNKNINLGKWEEKNALIWKTWLYNEWMRYVTIVKVSMKWEMSPFWFCHSMEIENMHLCSIDAICKEDPFFSSFTSIF